MTDSRRRKRVLILCTGNSCRSQMAEGFVNYVLADTWIAASAGTRPAERTHPLAIQVMAEAGIDLSHQKPKALESFSSGEWDLVITVCDGARESCPTFPSAAEQLHLAFPDPAEAIGAPEERIEVFRRVRDAIRDRLIPEIDVRG